jgi:predicted metal-dependent phosphoesterase TrpH
MIVDTHTHSRFSDGTQSPTELMEDAVDSGVDVIGLTDHDTTAGWDEALAAAGDLGVGLLRGVEVSTRYQGVTVHMLCYLHEPAGAELTAVIGRARRAREERTRIMVERIAEDYPITWDGLLELAGEHATLGRPHIADALVRIGAVATRSEAFAGLLGGGSKYHVPLEAIDPLEAVGLIHDAGGVAVFAHPLAAARGRVVPDRAFGELIAAGLDGIEVDHRDNPPAARQRLRRLAGDNGLFITGSSDYHGAGKPNRLAEHTTARDMLMRIAEAGRGTDLVLPR